MRGEPIVTKGEDGWYVELEGEPFMAGPTTKAIAEKMAEDVRRELRKSDWEAE